MFHIALTMRLIYEMLQYPYHRHIYRFYDVTTRQPVRVRARFTHLNESYSLMLIRPKCISLNSL